MALPAKYNVIAAFPDERRARSAVRLLTSEGLAESKVRLLLPTDGDPDQISELRAEMQDEIAEGWAAPSVGLATPQQAKGALWGTVAGTLLGTVIGAAVGAIWAFGFESTWSPVMRLLLVLIPFAVGGATAGIIAGGALKPRFEAQRGPHRSFDDKVLAGERDTLVAVHVDDARLAEEARRVLDGSGAERVDAVNADGTPLPPQSEHPRPADPADRWWWPGRSQG